MGVGLHSRERLLIRPYNVESLLDCPEGNEPMLTAEERMQYSRAHHKGGTLDAPFTMVQASLPPDMPS